MKILKMSDNCNTSPAYVLELPTRQDERDVQPRQIEDGALYRGSPKRDSGLVIDEDRSSYAPTPCMSDDEDTPPDCCDDVPLDALERGAAALSVPAVVAGGVGSLHFNINNGGSARPNRTSCSYDNGLTDERAESPGAAGAFDDEGNHAWARKGGGGNLPEDLALCCKQ